MPADPDEEEDRGQVDRVAYVVVRVGAGLDARYVLLGRLGVERRASSVERRASSVERRASSVEAAASSGCLYSGMYVGPGGADGLVNGSVAIQASNATAKVGRNRRLAAAPADVLPAM